MIRRILSSAMKGEGDVSIGRAILREAMSDLVQKGSTMRESVSDWQDGETVHVSWDSERAAREGLKSSTWLYACTNVIAKNISSIPWRVEKRGKGGTWVPVDRKHPLAELVDKPNPYQTRKQLMTLWVNYMVLSGNGIITKNVVKVFKEDVVAELWCVNPKLLRPVRSQSKWISHWEWQTDKHRLQSNDANVPREQVIHTMFVDPNDQHWGLSPVEVASRPIDTDKEATRWNLEALRNGAAPDGILSFKKEISRSQWNDARKALREQRLGSKYAHLPWVIGNEATWQATERTPIEMDFLSGRKFSMGEICAILGVPPSAIGDMEFSTMSNFETSRVVLWLETLIPLLDIIRDAFNLSLVPDFGSNIRLNYDLSKVPALSALMKQRFELAVKLHTRGIPWTELNRQFDLGLQEFDGWDTSWVSQGLLPASTAEKSTGSSSGGSAEDGAPVDGNPDNRPDQQDEHEEERSPNEESQQA